MKNILFYLKKKIYLFIKYLYNIKVNNIRIKFNKKIKFNDISIIISNIKKYKNLPKDILKNIGNYLKYVLTNIISSYKIIKQFINIKIRNIYYISIIDNINDLIFFKKKKKKIMIEFSSPNSNKSLHIGHFRNIVIGDTFSKVYKFYGYNIIKTQIINNKGVHICKSIIIYQIFYFKKIINNKIITKCYQYYQKMCDNNLLDKINLLNAVYNMLILWEKKNNRILYLWNIINNIMYSIFRKIYIKLGIQFNYTQYESDIYLLGKKIIYENINNKLFKKKKKFIYINLIKNNNNNKEILIRSDGSTLYFVQDIGLFFYRFNFFKLYKLLIISAEEQKKYFLNLYLILKKLNFNWINKISHISYGLVNINNKKMKSRCGKIVYITYLFNKIKKKINKIFYFKNKKINITDINKISIGILKYNFLKIPINNKLIFNIENILQYKGNSSIYIQYTYVRIISIIKNIKSSNIKCIKNIKNFNLFEKKIVQHILLHKLIIKNSINYNDISLLTNYIYKLSKLFNIYYDNIKIINFNNNIIYKFRINLLYVISRIIRIYTTLLGISLINKI